MTTLSAESLASIYGAAGAVDCVIKGIMPALPREANQILWRRELEKRGVPAPDIANVDQRTRFMAYARSEYQRARMFAAFSRHENIFLTGEGGTGKTEDIKQLIQILNNIYGDDSDAFFVTATTAMAAQHIKGITLHSWGGLFPAMETMTALEIASQIRQRDRRNGACRRWKKTAVLILDEVSMLSPNLFIKLDAVGRLLRDEPFRPWGGIQLVFSGDFAQLPPVPNKDIPGSGRPLCVIREFTNAFPSVFYKQFQWRSATDPIYSALLSDLRLGRFGPEHRAVLGSRYRANLDEFAAKGIEPTKMFPKNHDVDSANARRLEELRVFKVTEANRALQLAQVKIARHGRDSDEAKEATAAAQAAHMDAQVRTYVMQISVQRTADKHVRSGAVSRNVEPNMRQDVGDASYATRKALDACRAHQQVGLLSGAQVMLIANVDKENGLVNGSRGVVLNPAADGGVLVRFDDDSEVVIKPYKWKTENVRSARNVIVDITLTQIPLVLGYASTVHKAQGMSLSCGIIDLGELKAHGQGYVALSRMRELRGVSICAYSPDKITADPAVVAYYDYVDKHDTHVGFVETMCKIVPPKPSDLLALAAKIPAAFARNEAERLKIPVRNASAVDFSSAIASHTGKTAKGTKRTLEEPPVPAASAAAVAATISEHFKRGRVA